MDDDKCVGFVECPCVKCRKRRKDATQAHPDHGHNTRPYCGVCRTAEIKANYVRR